MEENNKLKKFGDKCEKFGWELIKLGAILALLTLE